MLQVLRYTWTNKNVGKTRKHLCLFVHFKYKCEQLKWVWVTTPCDYGDKNIRRFGGNSIMLHDNNTCCVSEIFPATAAACNLNKENKKMIGGKNQSGSTHLKAQQEQL